MGKHQYDTNTRNQNETSPNHIPKHGGPQTGNGVGYNQDRLPKGVVFRPASK